MTDDLRQKIRACPSLPSLPTIAVQVLELAQQEEVDLNQIARTITQDPALAGKILKTVNSSFYGRANAVSTVSHALVILGLQSVKTLVLGFSLVSNLTRDRSAGFDHMKYWRRSIYAATSARLLAAKVNFVQQEEAFLATLLADIGVLVLNKVLGAAYDEVHRAAASHGELYAAEQSRLGATHAAAGGVLAEMWRLPPLLSVPIAAHHTPEKAGDPQLVRLAQIVGLAGRCADVFVDAEPAAAITDARRQLGEQFEISEADADKLLEEIGAKTREAAALFEISIGQPIDYTAVLREANDALIELTLQTQHQADQLQQQNDALRLKAAVDGLTGLANRATFDEFLQQAFTRATAANEPLSLVMLDVDRFKGVNDKYGHPVGDAVLKCLGGLLKGIVRDCDLAARYGGEEMALVLPGTPRSIAATVAETIRRSILAQPVPCGATSVAVTASFGVASFETGSPFRAPGHLLKAADLALYKAKHSGRNNVKVFTLPAPPPPAAKVVAAA